MMTRTGPFAGRNPKWLIGFDTRYGSSAFTLDEGPAFSRNPKDWLLHAIQRTGFFTQSDDVEETLSHLLESWLWLPR